MLPSTPTPTNSSQTEDNWLDEFDKTYNLLVKENKFGNDVLPCVFRVPQNVLEISPLSYTPQRVGLGPYHHLRPEFHMLQWHKLAVIKNFITPEKFKNFQALVIDKLVKMESASRSCYAQILELKGLTLATILATDTIFLLHILNEHSSRGQIVDAAPEQVAKDLFMLENQIPTVILEEVRDALNLSPSIEDQSYYIQLFELCRAHSPLEVSLDYIFNAKCPHLLAFLHRLIVSYQVVPRPPRMTRIGLLTVITGMVSIVKTATNAYENVNKNMEGAESFVQKIAQFFKKPTPPEEEIEMPSVSQLQNSVKVKFVPTGNGIQQIEFMKSEDGSFYFCLPELTMKDDSEVILRNLVEYEKVMVDTTDDPKSVTTLVSDYVVLMCGIIHSAKDVGILRQENIIISELSDETIAKLFNGMKKSTNANKKWRLKEKSVVECAIEEANKEYDKTLRAKATKLFKKYLHGSWKPISFITVLVTVLLLAVQAICQFYGCNVTGTGFSILHVDM
ncbi:hypothetical protein Leryth_003279 [Lithospermum erythrorhizon]|nr:hypothetical protein Leryth_003279 [Lithospermum erythrorhizon]